MKIRDLVPWRTPAEVAGPWRSPESLFSRLENDMRDAVESFFQRPGWVPSMPTSMGAFTPKINVEETPDKVMVHAELPGLTDKDVQLSIADNHLTISGERKLEQEKKEGTTTYYESSYGSFRRVIPLGSEIDEDKIEASMKNGVLSVTLPKSPDARKQVRQISVKPE